MLPPLVADINIAVPVIRFLRANGVDVISAREEGWHSMKDAQIMAWAHDSDFGTLAFHRGEAFTGIIYLRPGGRPPAAVIADLQSLLDTEIDWTPPLMAVYQSGRLRLRKPDAIQTV